jgi:periplasmic protein TonB
MADSLLSSLPGAGMPAKDLASKASPAKNVQRTDSVDLLGLLRQSLSEGTQTPGAIMQAATEAARILSSADGVALALRTKGLIVCRARSGEPTPELGSPLNTESGISGECLRSASILICQDTYNDIRVDPDVCRQMGIRSIAVVPLRGPIGMVGILEAFSTRARTFGDEQINSLRGLAEIVESAYERECRILKDTALASLRSTVGRNLFSSKPAAVAAAAPAPVATTSESQSTETQPLGEVSLARKYWIYGAVVAAVLLVAGVWLSGREPDPGAAASTKPDRPAAAAAAPATENPTVAADPFPLPKPKAGLPRPDTSARPLKNAAEIETTKSSRAEVIVAGAPTSRAARAVLDASTEAPPPINAGSDMSGKQLAGLAASPSTLPTLAARVSQGTTGGQLIQRVEPVYPTQARAARLAGSVSLDVTIGEDGSVRDVKQVSGSPVLAAAATDAVRRWRYSPFLLNGQPLAVHKQVTVVFKLP